MPLPRAPCAQDQPRPCSYSLAENQARRLTNGADRNRVKLGCRGLAGSDREIIARIGNFDTTCGLAKIIVPRVHRIIFGCIDHAVKDLGLQVFHFYISTPLSLYLLSLLLLLV